MGTIRIFIAAVLLLALGSCGIYRFRDTGGMDFAKVKTANVKFLENRATYVSPQFAPKLYERLQQKVISGTKLARTNDETAGLVISGTVTNYDATQTVGISSTQATVNRLTVSIRMNVKYNYDPTKEPKDFSVSRSFDYPATQSLQQAEASLMDEIVRTMTDEIFNQIFSEW
ncbi:LPS assembly lipoprotein LptE [Sediminibacterium soli]|uniref:LPS assembly lipoprotein LptE n=1 Tax=Sediminibacterium soli TaxID=2698829 RepID=UPI00137AB979|nr:LPS assembly lipoprotein LptE [Sediminibacterium soli]